MPTTWSRRRKQRGGFSLIELVVVVLIVGVLAAFAIPQLIRTMESTKADDAAGIVKMIGTANRMYFVDKGAYVTGTLATNCETDCSKASGACALVACKYLGNMDWDSKAYTFSACSGSGANCCGIASPITPTTANQTVVACAKRKGDAQANYLQWGYTVTINGQMGYFSGTPPAPKPPS